MINIELTNTLQAKVCDLQYLTEIMGGKKHLMRGIMEEFLKQIPEELRNLTDAVARADYASIRSFAHTMKSSVSIMSVAVLNSVLEEMENLGARAIHIEEIRQLNYKLNVVCEQAIQEIEKEKHNYF